MATARLHGPSIAGSEAFSQQIIHTLNRFAASDIAKRALLGPFICLIGMLITVPLTSIHNTAPIFSYSLIALLAASAFLRFFISRSLKKTPDSSLGKWKILTSLAIFSTSLIWGLYQAANFYFYQFTIATMLVLVFTVAIAAGVAISLFIWKTLSQICIVVLFLPSFITLLPHWSATAASTLIGIIVYLVFLYVQIIRSNKEYWGALNANQLLKNKARELAEISQLAESASKAKSEFLSSMSHELRTPLNAIIGFTQILEMDSAQYSEEHKEHLHYISDAGKHLLELINRILDLARIESGKVELDCEKVSLKDVIEQCRPLIENLANDKNIKLDFEEADNEVMADYMRLKQVLLNLLSNGIKYNKPGGELRISYEPLAEMVKVNVIDTGMGIAEEHHGSVFTSFSRFTSDASNIEGSGVGLAISKSLIEAMEGEIGFTSQQGQGSTFWIKLPKA